MTLKALLVGIAWLFVLGFPLAMAVPFPGEDKDTAMMASLQRWMKRFKVEGRA